MTALQFLADSSANDAIREKLREFPNRVYFPNFGKGDNIFKEGIDIDRVLFTVPGTNFKIYWYGFFNNHRYSSCDDIRLQKNEDRRHRP